MRLAGRDGEGRWHRDQLGSSLGQSFEQGREAQVVANRQPERADRRAANHHRALAARIDRGFAPALAGRQIDVEQMDLVVAGADLALVIDDERTVGDLAGARANGERSEMDPQSVVARRGAAGGEDDVLAFLADRGGGAPGIAVEEP